MLLLDSDVLIDIQRGRSATVGVPPFAGVVESVNEEYKLLLLRLDEPAPGIANVFANPMGGKVYLALSMYLYGDAPPC